MERFNEQSETYEVQWIEPQADPRYPPAGMARPYWVQDFSYDPGDGSGGDPGYWMEFAGLPRETLSGDFQTTDLEQAGKVSGPAGAQGGTAKYWISPSGSLSRLVLRSDGIPVVELPRDIVYGWTVDNSANMSAFGQIASLFEGPIGIAAGAAFMPMNEWMEKYGV